MTPRASLPSSLSPQPRTLSVALTVWRQSPSEREAVRIANGARPAVERANAAAALGAVLLFAAALLAVFLRGEL